jgi:hypothetical protein
VARARHAVASPTACADDNSHPAVEFIVLPDVIYIDENIMPCRIFTVSRRRGADLLSIGQWLDTDGDGRFGTLEIETRNCKGPASHGAERTSSARAQSDHRQERIYPNKANKDLMVNEITVIGQAFTRPWTLTTHCQHIPNDRWYEANCAENNNHFIISKEDYFMSGDSLMPAARHRALPDWRYFQADATNESCGAPATIQHCRRVAVPRCAPAPLRPRGIGLPSQPCWDSGWRAPHSCRLAPPRKSAAPRPITDIASQVCVSALAPVGAAASIPRSRRGIPRSS